MTCCDPDPCDPCLNPSPAAAGEAGPTGRIKGLCILPTTQSRCFGTTPRAHWREVGEEPAVAETVSQTCPHPACRPPSPAGEGLILAMVRTGQTIESLSRRLRPLRSLPTGFFLLQPAPSALRQLKHPPRVGGRGGSNFVDGNAAQFGDDFGNPRDERRFVALAALPLVGLIG